MKLQSFISLQAKTPLGFDLYVRQSVESNICYQNLDNENLENFVSSYSNSFYVPMLIVFNILDKVYFKKFLESNLYKKYITEIKNSSQLVPVQKNQIKFHRENNKAKINESNADSLWSRPETNMQLGKIDSNGRYISQFGKSSIKVETNLIDIFSDSHVDLDDAWSLNTFESPDASKSNPSSSNIKLKLEKFLNMLPANYSKKTNEDIEIAEQLADMLVKDVERDNNLLFKV